MKGISPIVAAVLLIAITMTIAGLLAYWSATFVRQALPPLNETEAMCRFADFLIYSCSYNSTERKLTLILNNIRSVELKDLVLYLYFSNATVSSGYALNETLLPGAFQTYTLRNIPDFLKVIVSSRVCPELSKESTCTR